MSDNSVQFNSVLASYDVSVCLNTLVTDNQTITNAHT